MNVDHIFEVFNRHQVRYILIGGMNFLLRHQPVLTFDVDLWIDPADDNLRRAEAALAELEAAWGATEESWEPVSRMSAGWLGRQAVYCLTSPHGAIDIFLAVAGLESWAACRNRSLSERTSGGIEYPGLSDADMLRCQEVLDAGLRKTDRIRVLKQQVNGHEHDT